VEHALVVGERHRVADAQDHFERARQRPVVAAAVRLDEHLARRAPFHEAHREVHLAMLVEPELVHRDDPRVVELRGDLRFFEEAPEQLAGELPFEIVARRLAVEQHLHRQPSVQLPVVDPQDGAHAAAIDLAFDRVAVEVQPRRTREALQHLLGLGRVHAGGVVVAVRRSCIRWRIGLGHGGARVQLALHAVGAPTEPAGDA
jgi:hypothetical protein